MTLNELRYIVALARERHFGRAAAACFVSQPTLSVALRKLEDELGLKLFERGHSDVAATPVGAEIVAQAREVLAGVEAIGQIARRGQDPTVGPMSLGVIHTVGPYLLPPLVQAHIARHPRMPLTLREDITTRLLDDLRGGALDAAILAEPFDDHGLGSALLYDEPMRLAVPRDHRLAASATVDPAELADEPLLLLGAGHCLRDQVLQACADPGRRDGRGIEGSSLETLKHMVAAGLGVTVLPVLAMPEPPSPLWRTVPLRPQPSRRIVLAWRKSHPRRAALDALRDSVRHAGVAERLAAITADAAAG